MRSNNKKGFTMIEILIVISIMVLIMGITIPRFTRSSQGAALKTSADNIAALLETAKSYALSQHDYYEVYFDGADRIILRKEDSDTGDMVPVEGGCEIPGGIVVTFTADDIVRFTPMGTVDSPDGDIVVSSSSINKQRTITINSTTGYVKIQ